MEDDEREIIFLALNNSLDYYKELLESGGIDTKDIPLIEYLIKRHCEIINKVSLDIVPIEGTPIKRPQW